MFTVYVERTFNASHQLTMPNGTKESMHAHDWVVKTAVSAKTTNKAGLAIDFDFLKAMVDAVIAPFRNAQLEKLNCFAGVNTSAENVAKFIYGAILPHLSSKVKLEYVEVTEQAGCSARYWE